MCRKGGVVGKCTRLTIRVFFVVQHPPPSLPPFIFTPPPPGTVLQILETVGRDGVEV